MHKRVLIAEYSDTVRGVAEALLRQNSFEVISVTSGDQVLEVLEFTKPDIVLIASDMTCKGSKLLYDEVISDSRYSAIPQLVMAPAEDSSLPLPPEMILTKPFEPKDFIARIKTFVGQGDTPAKPAVVSSAASADSSAEVDDALLDMALGIDQLEVTDSEIMGQSTKITKKKKQPEKMIGYEHTDPDTEMNGDSGKVESLMIREDNPAASNKPKNEQNPTGTGKLEILNDQFGLIDNEQLSPEPKNADHDYEWFLNELQKEGEEQVPPPAPKKKAAVPQQTISDSQKLDLHDNSTYVDPVTPVKSPSPHTTDSNVDSFIDEFKKEIEKIGSDIPDSVTLNESSPANTKQPISWEDKVEQITPEQIALFKKEFVAEIAQKVAIMIADKIDSEKLLFLLKQEIINKAKK